MVALREELRRPPGVFGPVDFAALARFAASCFSEISMRSDSGMGFTGCGVKLLILFSEIDDNGKYGRR